MNLGIFVSSSIEEILNLQENGLRKISQMIVSGITLPFNPTIRLSIAGTLH